MISPINERMAAEMVYQTARALLATTTLPVTPEAKRLYECCELFARVREPLAHEVPGVTLPLIPRGRVVRTTHHITDENNEGKFVLIEGSHGKVIDYQLGGHSDYVYAIEFAGHEDPWFLRACDIDELTGTWESDETEVYGTSEDVEDQLAAFIRDEMDNRRQCIVTSPDNRGYHVRITCQLVDAGDPYEDSIVVMDDDND